MRKDEIGQHDLAAEPPSRVEPSRISHVSLRVRDLEQSARFYHAVFDLERRDDSSASRRRCRCEITDLAGGQPPFAVELTEGGPILSGGGMNHFSLEVGSVRHVSVACRRAREAGARTTAPRRTGDRWHAFVFDPDGHKIEVCASESDSRARSLAGEQTRIACTA